MFFNSIDYVFFLIIVYTLYRMMRLRAQNVMLLLASYVFYGWWDIRFLFLIICSTVVDYSAGLMISSGRMEKRQRAAAALSLILASVFLVLADWSAVNWQMGSVYIDWNEITTGTAGWLVVGGSVLVVGVGWHFYPILSKMDESKRRRFFLILSIVVNLSILGFFKYFNFFVDNLESLLVGFGIDVMKLRLHILLPVGISFYTFQTMSYTIDIYRREMNPTDRFLDFALFVAYFPQLVAGPIERARRLIPQISNTRKITLDQTSRGLYLILYGLLKKIAIADGIAITVDQVYNAGVTLTWADIVVGTSLFAVQIYCDFSGYSDIARGTSKLLGIDLMTNFRLPYFSTNPQEFWQRWHISLSTWLRDYLYIPLGGNRCGTISVYRNLMITMMLGGLWHGARWNFVLWGIYHGLLLSIHRMRTINSGQPGSVKKNNFVRQLGSIGFFFVLTCYGWVLFRATSFEQIAMFTQVLITDFGTIDLGITLPRFSALLGLILLIVLEVTEYLFGQEHYYRRLPTYLRGPLVSAMIVITMMGMSNESAQFIYFQF